MGFCSYCYRHAGSSYGLSDECYSYEQARACSGITGPDDPIRLERKRAYEANHMAKDLTGPNGFQHIETAPRDGKRPREP